MAQHREASGARQILRLTKRACLVQRRLFGLERKNFAPLEEGAMARLLQGLRRAPELEPFRIWLVGSRLESGHTQSDIDLVLSPRAGPVPDDATVEHGLWYCRDYGLFGARPACVIDPCFRSAGPATDAVPLRPDTLLTGVKLLSPRLSALIARRAIADYRRSGEISVAYRRRAGDTDFFAKLPVRLFDGEPCAFLRPAVEIG